MPLCRRSLCTALALSPLAAARASEGPAGFPGRAVKFIVPFPPGNSSDVAARLIGEQLGKKYNVPFIVENRVGAAGQLGASAVARAEPDGHTLLMTSTSFTISPALYKSLPYSLAADFAPVVCVSTAPMVLVVRPDFPAATTDEFVREIRRQPARYNYAHNGAGTIQHLTAEAFLAAIGQPINAVPYKGSAQALTDLIGGQVQFMFDAVLSARTLIEAGKLKALGVTSPGRTELLRSVPPMAESTTPGAAGFTIEGWAGLLAPRATPPAVVDWLNKEISAVLYSDEMRERLRTASILPPGNHSAAQFGSFLQADLQKWQKAATAARLEKE